MAMLLAERQTTKDAEVAHHQLAPVPGLGGRAVEEMDDGHHCLTVVDRRHPSMLEEGPGGGHHHLVSAPDCGVYVAEM